MITRGLESAANGMKTLIEYQDVVANNIANVNTTSFKRTNLAFKNIMDMAIEEKSKFNEFQSQARPLGSLSAGSGVDYRYLDFSQGVMVQTGNSLDLALLSEGFFKVQEKQTVGQPYNENNFYYTRNGSFHLNEDYYLVNNLGDFVMDSENRRIRIARDPDDPNNNINNRVDVQKDIAIFENGQIHITNPDYARTLQKIQIVDFQDKSKLGQIGDSRYREILGQNAGRFEVTGNVGITQGSLEGSNVNTVNEMIHTIEITRAYETLSTMVREQGDLLSQAIELGKIRG